MLLLKLPLWWKGRFCRVTTCQNEHLQGRKGGPVAFECASVPEFDIGPITAPDNTTVCCLRVYWTEDMPLILDPPRQTTAALAAQGLGFGLSNPIFISTSQKPRQRPDKMFSWNMFIIQGILRFIEGWSSRGHPFSVSSQHFHLSKSLLGLKIKADCEEQMF